MKLLKSLIHEKANNKINWKITNWFALGGIFLGLLLIVILFNNKLILGNKNLLSSHKNTKNAKVSPIPTAWTPTYDPSLSVDESTSHYQYYPTSEPTQIQQQTQQTQTQNTYVPMPTDDLVWCTVSYSATHIVQIYHLTQAECDSAQAEANQPPPTIQPAPTIDPKEYAMPTTLPPLPTTCPYQQVNLCN